MAEELPSSQCNSEMVPGERPVVSGEIFYATKVVGEFLVRYLGLPEEQNYVEVEIEEFDPTPEQIKTKQQNVQFEIQCVTRFGDTVLHWLVTDSENNEVALKVVQKEMSLLRVRNKKLETPLHCAAKAGNDEFIQSLVKLAPDVVKDMLGETNDNNDTALFVATKNCQKFVVRELMKLDPEMAYKVNKEGLSPLHMAIVDGCTDMVKIMLEVEPALAYTQFSDGMFPVHVAARMGNKELVMHFFERYLGCVHLLDLCGRNIFHIAAAENKIDVFTAVLKQKRYLIHTLIRDQDYEGNTPFHIAAMKGNRAIVRYIWSNLCRNEFKANNKGLTPFDLSVIQLKHTIKGIEGKINCYVKRSGRKFSFQWFENIMKPSSSLDIAEKKQVIGLGSVLITTVAFAAAFTFPGGYNADNGTPVLGRKYMFRAFQLANFLAFAEAFASVFLLVTNILGTPDDESIESAEFYFVFAANSLVKAFGIGSYVTLAPVSMPIAIIFLVLGLLFGSYSIRFLTGGLKHLMHWLSNWTTARVAYVTAMAAWNALPLLLIFGLAFLK